MTTMTTEHVKINDIQIAQTIAGDGAPIVFLHGWGANIDLIRPLTEALCRYGYRCYSMDMPGFGKSAEPPEPWSVIDYANFVLAYLDYHELADVFLFGHSFGGRLALVLGSEHPARFKKIVLSNSAGIKPPAAFWPQFRLKSYKAVRDSMAAVGLGAAAAYLERQYNNRYGSADFRQATGVMRETFVKVINQDLLDYAARMRPSTLLFWGDADEETPLWMGQKLEKTIPDAGLIIHKGAGHYAYLDFLADTARIMDHFFRSD